MTGENENSSDTDIPEDNDISQENNQTIQSINKSQGRNQIRQIIDIMLLSGIDEDEIENILRDLADGVQYYSEDIKWYNANTQEEINNES